MYFVYILLSQKNRSRYIGVTQNIQRRLAEHNNGNSAYTKTKRPYILLWYSGFLSKELAYSFEKYLKSSSGYAFTKKHLI